MSAVGAAAPEAALPTFPTVAAQAALAGCCLHELASGAYLLTKPGWAMCRELGTLVDVQKLLAQMTGQST